MPEKTILHVTSENEGVYSNAKFPGTTAVIIPNGVDVPAKAKTMWHDGKLPILFLGRLDPIKAIENLITACSLLRGVDWSLTIAGAGDKSYADRLKDAVRQLNLCDRVQMVGHVIGEMKDLLYERNDLLVLPSHGENFGMAVAEALAYGIPVIASKGTPWSRVEEVGCGLWTNNTPQDLASAIQRISQMPLQDMGAKGRSWMQADFSWTACARRMARVYHEFAQS
jgi:glycosyltransferase involved in cell wall biosynthesis